MELINKEQAKKILKPAILATLSQVPVVSAFSTLYAEFVNSNWQEKQEKVQSEIINKFSQLDEQFEQKIRKRSNFASILGTVYQGALTDIDENKIPLYVSSLINAINNENIDNTKIHIFFNFLKEFTLLHIKTLKFLAAIKGNNKPHELDSFAIKSREELIAERIGHTAPEIIKDINLLNNVINDLYIKGLLRISNLSGISLDSFNNPNKIYSKFTTELGDEFLNFIR